MVAQVAPAAAFRAGDAGVIWRDLYAFPGVEPAALPVPADFLRASHGMLNEPDKPLYPPGAAEHWLPGTKESTVDGVNHYTITLGPTGAAAIARAVRQGVADSPVT